MWYDVENGEPVRPSSIDQTSSKVYTYVRRNITLVEGDDEVQDHYRWQEYRVPKEVWEVYQTASNASQATEMNGDAIADLSEVVSETDVSVSVLLDAIADLSTDVSALYDAVEGGEQS